jgi:hypothetical protein
VARPAVRGRGAAAVAELLYRVELGEPVAPEDPLYVRLDGHALASRLSYLVWNTTPDDELLDAAAAGELADEAGIAAQVDRLFASPRAQDGVIQLFVDMFDLDALLSLQKDAALLPAFTPTIGPAMREEVVRVIADAVLEQRDYRRCSPPTAGSSTPSWPRCTAWRARSTASSCRSCCPRVAAAC